MQLNTPWTESLFFEEELAERQHLTAEQKEQARHYHEKGYLRLPGFFSTEVIAKAKAALIKNHQADPGTNRALDLWKKVPELRQLATHPQVLALLRLLYEREPIPFQTLHFQKGSEQKPHSDSLQFNSMPARFMCGAWIALEKMDEENGTLVYFPGSHRLNIYNLHHLDPAFEVGTATYQEKYAPFIDRLMQEHQIEPQAFEAEPGDLILWSANLVHGGLPHRDKTRSRWSQVTHYFFENCLYYNPRASNPISGEWSMDKITDIRTGKRVAGNYNGQAVRRKAAAPGRFLISPNLSYDWRDLSLMLRKIWYKLRS